MTSGEGGNIIINEAETVLAKEFPDLRIKLVVPDEKTKRHGQAVAAASLPPLAASTACSCSEKGAALAGSL